MSMKFKIDGLSELQTALRELPDATAKNVIRRVLKKAGQPIADRARELAPVDEGDLRDSIKVGTRLSGNQRRKHRKAQKDDVEMFVGAGPHPQAHLQEFGTSKFPPQPFMRPAWDQHKRAALNGIKEDLWTEIRKAAARLARKAAKLKG